MCVKMLNLPKFALDNEGSFTVAGIYSAATTTGVTQTKLTNHKAEQKQ